MANYDKKSGHIFTPDGKIYPNELFMIEMMFDNNVNIDIQEIELEMKQKELLNKVCKLKINTYWFELFFTWWYLPKGWVSERKEQHLVYKEFLKGKMSILDFNMKLMAISDKYLKEKSPE